MEYLIAAGAFVGGGVVGGIAMAVIASGKMADIQSSLYGSQRRCGSLKKENLKLVAENGSLVALRNNMDSRLRAAWEEIEVTKANLKQMVVSYRGNKGRYTRGSAYDALEFHLSKKDA